MDEYGFDPEAYAAGDTPQVTTPTFDPNAYGNYKEQLTQKILSGATDYTYGPGSPGATPSDMRQRVGSRDNKLQTGDIALPEQDYKLFTPQEREKLGIADTSWITEGKPTPRGSVERYFGPDAQGFNPKAYATGKPTIPPLSQAPPDIHAFVEPAPAETPEPTPEGPSASEQIGSAVGKGISKLGQAIANQPIPHFTTPQFQPTPIPQTAAPQNQVIGTPSGPMIPTPTMPPQATPQPMPTPAPYQQAPVVQGVGEGLAQTAQSLVPHTMEQFKGLAQMMGAPTDPFGFFQSALQQGLVTAKTAQDAIKAGPLSKEAGKAYGTIIPQALAAYSGLSAAGAAPSAATIGRSLVGKNLLPRAQELGGVGITGGPKGISQTAQVTSAREVPVPESFQPKGATESEATPILPPTKPQGLPVKAASVQGLKNPPRQSIQWMKEDVALLKSQGRHAEAKVLQGKINQAEGLTVGQNVGGQPPPQQPPPPAAPPPQNPPPGGGIPPQPPKNVPEALRNRQIVDRITSGHDSVFTRADYDARQKVNPLRQEFGEQPTRSPKLKENIEANKDMEAATFITEAQGNKVALKQDADLIRTSKNKKLADKYGPIVQYALDNFDRLSQQFAKSRYTKLMADQLAEDVASGITYGEREGYVTHVLRSEPPDSLISMFTGKMGSGGLSRYFTKNREFGTLAEAINAGVEPASINLADLAQHRIASSRRLILNKALFNELKNIVGPDGNPVIKGIFRHPDPPHGPIIPKGYDLLNANGVEIASHPEYTGIFKALYGDSALRRTATGRAVMRGAAISKSYTLAADTYHGFRGIQKGLFYGGKGSRLGYNKGTTVYELSNEALDTAVKSGEISQGQADWAKSARPAVEEMMKNGLNVSRYADNLVGQLHVQFPGTRGLNNWIFNRVFRGAMIQASHANYLRNLSRWPELTKREVARKTAKEMNEVFGNLMNQGLIRDKTVRDAANLTFLAPQWVESQARAEFRGYGQAAKIIPDALRGKFRVGTIAQGQATAVAAYLLGNQIINYATTGHSTFENGDGHKLSAFLPIGDRGVYLDPLALSAEYVDRFMQILDRQGDNASIPGVISEMARNKLSRTAQAVVTLATQRDWRGRTLSGGALYGAAATEALPIPIAGNIVGASGVQLDPNSPMGFAFDPQYDKITQQVLQSMGQRGVLGPATSQYQDAPVRVPTRTRHKGVY